MIISFVLQITHKLFLQFERRPQQQYKRQGAKTKQNRNMNELRSYIILFKMFRFTIIIIISNTDQLNIAYLLSGYAVYVIISLKNNIIQHIWPQGSIMWGSHKHLLYYYFFRRLHEAEIIQCKKPYVDMYIYLIC